MIVGYSPYRLMKIFYYLFSIVDLLMFSLKIFIFPLFLPKNMLYCFLTISFVYFLFFNVGFSPNKNIIICFILKYLLTASLFISVVRLK